MKDRSSLAESILEQMADAVIYADDTGTIRRWNHAAAALFGYSAAEALGQNLDLIVPEHLRAAHWRGFERAVGEWATRLGRRAMLTKALHGNGDAFYVDMSCAVVRDRGATSYRSRRSPKYGRPLISRRFPRGGPVRG